MAVIASTVLPSPPEQLTGEVLVYKWGPLTETDTATPIRAAEFADRSVQIDGNFGTGGTVLLEISNDGATWFTATDPQGNLVSATSAKLEQIQDVSAWVRPRVSAGTGVSINVHLCSRRTLR